MKKEENPFTIKKIGEVVEKIPQKTHLFWIVVVLCLVGVWGISFASKSTERALEREYETIDRMKNLWQSESAAQEEFIEKSSQRQKDYIKQVDSACEAIKELEPESHRVPKVYFDRCFQDEKKNLNSGS